MSINPNHSGSVTSSDFGSIVLFQEVRPALQTGMNDLPTEILQFIFGLLNDSKVTVLFINKRFYAIADQTIVKNLRIRKAFEARVASNLNAKKPALFEWAALNLGYTIKHKHRLNWGVWQKTLYEFVENERLDIIKKLNLAKANNIDIDRLYYAAAQFGKIEILDWLHAEGYKPTHYRETNPFNELVMTAKIFGKPEVLQWLLNKGM